MAGRRSAASEVSEAGWLQLIQSPLIRSSSQPVRWSFVCLFVCLFVRSIVRSPPYEGSAKKGEYTSSASALLLAAHTVCITCPHTAFLCNEQHAWRPTTQPHPSNSARLPPLVQRPSTHTLKPQTSTSEWCGWLDFVESNQRSSAVVSS